MSRTIALLLLLNLVVVGCAGASPVASDAPGTPVASPSASATMPLRSPAASPSILATPTQPSSMATPAPLQVEASIALFRFEPQRLQVRAGTTIVWTNLDDVRHTVTSGPADKPDGKFDSGLLEQHRSYEFRFDVPGLYAYFCNLHPRMTGEVEVVP